jgi:hypothetical protein
MGLCLHLTHLLHASLGYQRIMMLELINLLNLFFCSNTRVNFGIVWFTKCNTKGNGNGLHSITVGNKFE